MNQQKESKQTEKRGEAFAPRSFVMMQEISPGNISVISTKAPYGASAMHDRHVRKGSCDSVLHTFVRKCAEKMSCFRDLLSAAGVCIP